MRALRAFTIVVLSLGLLAAACGGGGSESPAQAKDKIKAAYAAFFNPKGSLTQKTGLIENGSKIVPCLQTQSTNPQLSQLGGASVVSIVLKGDSSATVQFNLLGTTGTTLTPAPFAGAAVKQNGTWKVAQATFNSLLSLGGTHC